MQKHTSSAPLRVLLFLLAILVVGALVLTAAVGWGIKYYNAPGNTEEIVTVLIPKGTGFEQITDILHESQLIEHPLAFAAIAIALDKSRLIKAGEYEFPANVSPKEILASLIEGKTVIHKITVPEGYSTSQVLSIITQEEKLVGNTPVDIQEGELLPETYYFSRGDDRGEIISRMKRDMRVALMDLWEKRRTDLPFRTPQEALTLASIVEKETGVESEYTTVASVYINRLHKGMLLQADPTVIYAITQGKETLGRALKYSDLRLDSPYNTYVTVGLPPGPIANPGRKALEAAFNPANTDYIFFVADGKGGHNFSNNLSQHNSYVSQFRTVLKNQRAKNESAAREENKSKPAEAAKAPTPVVVASPPVIEPIVQEVPLTETAPVETPLTDIPAADPVPANDTVSVPLIVPEPTKAP